MRYEDENTVRYRQVSGTHTHSIIHTYIYIHIYNVNKQNIFKILANSYMNIEIHYVSVIVTIRINLNASEG